MKQSQFYMLQGFIQWAIARSFPENDWPYHLFFVIGAISLIIGIVNAYKEDQEK